MSKLCPQCGAPIDEGAVKCEWCGAAIKTDAIADVGAPVEAPVGAPVGKSCPQCGAPVDEGAVKCEWCGAAIKTDAIADVGAPVGAPVGKPCPQCGAPVDEGAVKCEWCGAAITADAGAPIDTPFTPVDTSSSDFGDITPNNNVDVSLPLKSRIVAGLLAILLGGLGIHKFYLGQIGKGILYILFCWTYIPAIIAFIEGIMILCKSDTDFEVKYNCRTK